MTAQGSRNASLTWLHHVSLSTEAHHQHYAFAKPWQCTCFPISHPPPLVVCVLTGEGQNKVEMGTSWFEEVESATLQEGGLFSEE